MPLITMLELRERTFFFIIFLSLYVCVTHHKFISFGSFYCFSFLCFSNGPLCFNFYAFVINEYVCEIECYTFDKMRYNKVEIFRTSIE